jgi:hypothetical protein
MNPLISRRTFVTMTSAACAALPVGVTIEARPEGDDELRLPEAFPSHDPASVREIVGKSHRDAEGVKKLVEARPELAKAVWDWGFGDWESALGAASHVGRRDIAEILIANGARPDIFTFAMLGDLDAVRAIIAANPGIQRAHGPHGITLLAHARNGGEPAAVVVEYLQSLGDADIAATDLPLNDAQRAALMGDYEYELEDRRTMVDAGGARAMCTILEQRGGLQFKHDPGGTPLRLLHQGDGTFHPAGAPHVRVVIQQAVLTISTGSIVVTAVRRT